MKSQGSRCTPRLTNARTEAREASFLWFRQGRSRARLCEALCGSWALMENTSINDLALSTEKEFAFLERLGIHLIEWAELFPESAN